MKLLSAVFELTDSVRRLAFMLLLGAAGAYFTYGILSNLQVERNNVSIYIHDPHVAPLSLSIAVLGDLHLPEGLEPLDEFRELLLEVRAAAPDLVLLVGDYVRDPRGQSLSGHRENIIEAMKLVDPVPRAIVLGNYESWSNADDWLTEFERFSVDALENEVTIFETAKGPICVRGLGDYFTGRFVYVDYPEACKNIAKLTITHDPAGAFDRRMKGLVIAGHTHCGQINLPYIGPLWVPTDAPPFAHCGLHEGDEITVFVTSGVGTSIFPLRIGTQSQWDFISLSIKD
ncbi:metallophosphoesterase [Yoonia sp.]|uniref:metallophosphoesterase n=1 Tax=Yoonia sp. TaxID=2212373 RepID=UPI0040479CFB